MFNLLTKLLATTARPLEHVQPLDGGVPRCALNLAPHCYALVEGIIATCFAKAAASESPLLARTIILIIHT
jgi:hypothetical protein